MSTEAERFRRIIEVFQEVCDLPPAELSGRLSAICGSDARLVDEVRRLVDAENENSVRLEPPPFSGVPPAPESPGGRPERSLSGSRIAQFEVGKRIGRGGMGDVYAGVDTTLRRDVALKTIRRDQRLCETARRRFLREARMLSSLDHANICRIYEYLQGERMDLLVLELLDGEALNRKIERRDDLSLSEKLTYLLQLARGLKHAHAAGVVHRDLKPANIHILPDGNLKIVDFGLALLPQQDSRLTGVGQTIGTTAYLAPEQIEGGELDQRVDVFAFGTLSYELLTYEQAFRGESISAVMFQIVSGDPPPIRVHRPEYPDDLVKLVERCLEKDPDDRPRGFGEIVAELTRIHAASTAAPPVPTSAGDRETERTATTRGSRGPSAMPAAGKGRRTRPAAVLAALLTAAVSLAIAGTTVWLTSAEQRSLGRELASRESATPEPTSIAVLPFADMSENRDQEYLSDGIAEELLNLLSRVPELRVTARTSAFSFKGESLGMPEIARRLNVAHILEGSVRKAGDHVRVTTQLIDARSDRSLWSRTYDRTLEDVFAVQDDIAADVVAQLQVTLLGEVPRVEVTHPEAYELFLQARYLSHLSTAEGVEQAIEVSNRALALDPSSAAAWGELGHAYLLAAAPALANPRLPTTHALRLSRDALRRALALAPDFALAYARLAIVERYLFDLPAAARHVERALDLEPNNPYVLGNASHIAVDLGRPDEAVALSERGVALNPLSPTGQSNMGHAYYHAGLQEKAIVAYRTALSLSPDTPGYPFYLGAALLQHGELEAALAAIRSERFVPARWVGLALVHHALGERAEADAALLEVIDHHSRGRAYNIAYILAFRGETERAFEWLARAKAAEALLAPNEVFVDPHLRWRLPVEPLFANLHTDPRWERFLRTLGKAPEQLAAIQLDLTLPR